jgi:hypothetical protein
MDKLIQLMREKKIGKVLTGTRRMGAISPEDQDWSFHNWLPRAVEAGHRCIALMASEDILRLMSVEGTDFVSQYFSNPRAGRTWLATQ